MIKKLKGLLDAQEKHFVKGGRFERWYPLYEALHTFHFSPTDVTKSSVQIRDNIDTKRYMIMVVVALLPCVLFGIYNAGYQTLLASGLEISLFSVLWSGSLSVLPIIITSYAVGGLCELVFSIVRKHEINEGFLVSGLLFPLTLPPTIPLWQVALGITFGIVLGKEVFGGTGKNFLNPALTARAFVYFSYPAYMSGEVWTLLKVSKDKIVDGYTMATPLLIAPLVEKSGEVWSSIQSAGYTLSSLFIGLYPGSIGETSMICILFGAVLLIVTKIASWRIMAGSVIGLFLMTIVFNAIAGPTILPFFELGPIVHLMIGSFAFGIVFMATDPVSAPDLNGAKWVYGILIGVLTVIIRVANPAYPEGVMLAILLMNVFAPALDHVFLTRKLKKRIPNVI